MKIVELLNAQPVLENVIQRKMPSKLAYALAKNVRLMTTDLEDYNKARLKLLSDNWKLNDKTGQYDIPDDDKPRWKEIHDALIQSECGYQPFKIDLAFAEQVDWSPNELLTLWFLFQGEGAEALAPANNK